MPESICFLDVKYFFGGMTMYQVLYRKWRPQTFSDVYGQPMITTALKNELRTGRIAHAYLFTGSRGTGKTSCAKILAKAVNCINPQDGDPCNSCENCKGIDDGTILDVVEIDAASNNGVDSIRDLREEVNFTPSVARYRVYIIDEVHMLSTGAFNALLKTLEEPPSHVIFVLATTEVHKLPATILSRCQRFDFRRILPDDIASRINYIAEHEDFTVTQDAAFLIASLADGGMRDALSLLDQCISRSNQVTADVVTQAAGLAGHDYLFELSEAVRENNSGEALAIIGRLHESSRDMERLCSEFVEFYRNLMIIKSVPNPTGLIIAPPSELERLSAEAGNYQLPVLLHCIDTLQNALERIKAGSSRRIAMEMAILRMCSPELDVSFDSLLRRINALESAFKAGRVVVHQHSAASEAVSKNVQQDNVSSSSEVNNTDRMDSPTKPPVSAADKDTETEFTGWNDVIDALAISCQPLYGVLQGSSAYLRGDFVLIETDNDLFKSLVTRDGNTRILSDAIKSVTGRNYRIGIKKKPAVQSESSNDPLSAFIRTSRELGVNMDIK
jgi:DNA polymerase-3 subunit gamma/tau